MAYAINDNKSKSEIVVLKGVSSGTSTDREVGPSELSAAGIDNIHEWAIVSASLGDELSPGNKWYGVIGIGLATYKPSNSAGYIYFKVTSASSTYNYEFVLIKIA